MATLYSKTLDTDATGWEGRTLRQLLPAAGVASLGQIRVRFTAGSGGMQIDHASVALKGAATFPNVTTTPPAILTFSGAAGFNIASSATTTSDWLTFAAETTDQIAVIIDFTAGGTKGTFTYASEAGAATQYKIDASSYQDATVTGYTSAGANTVIALIETQAVPATPGGTATMMGV